MQSLLLHMANTVVKALLHLSRLIVPSPLRTNPYTMNAHICALTASTLAKCERERAMIYDTIILGLPRDCCLLVVGKRWQCSFAAI